MVEAIVSYAFRHLHRPDIIAVRYDLLVIVRMRLAVVPCTGYLGITLTII